MPERGINLTRFQDVSASSTILAATDLSSTPRNLAAAKAGTTIYVTKAILAVTTDNAATQTLQDTAGTPIIVAKSKASPGIGPITWDFGEDGFALTADKGLDIANSAAGLAGAWSVEAYRRPTKDIAIVP